MRWVENRISKNVTIWNCKKNNITFGGYTLEVGEPVKWWAGEERGTVNSPRQAKVAIKRAKSE